MVLMYMVPVVLSWHTSVDVMVAMADPANRPGDTDPKGLSILTLGGSSSINDQAISLKPKVASLVGLQKPLDWGLSRGRLR